MTNQNQFSISFTPTSEELDHIYNWLLEEEQNERLAGFFCNWNSIKYSLDTKEMAIICVAEYPVGFLTWLSSERTAKIQIAEIKPGHRKQGLGTKLTNAVFDHLRAHGIVAVRLHCQPQQSERAWKKMGFKNFPSVEEMQSFNNAEEGRNLYHILIPHLEPKEIVNACETLELWSVGSYMKDKTPPKWFWNLDFKGDTRELIKPIIAPAKYKWNIRWKKDEQIIKDTDIKYFSKSEIHFDTFLMITELPK